MKQVTITLTLNEATTLALCCDNGWGDGDLADSLNASEARACQRAMTKLRNAIARAAALKEAGPQ